MSNAVTISNYRLTKVSVDLKKHETPELTMEK